MSNVKNRMSMKAAKATSEKDFQAQVVEFAKLNGWRCYHTHDSRRSTAGYPDLTMVRGNRLVFAELKREDGKLTRQQGDWLDSLYWAGTEVHVWKPSDWKEVEEVLGRKA